MELDFTTVPAAGDDSNAAVLAAALGLDRSALATLPAAAQTEEREQAVMQRALFEATWGPYLRQLAVPALDPRRVPQIYGFVTEHLRPGGPLPVIVANCLRRANSRLFSRVRNRTELAIPLQFVRLTSSSEWHCLGVIGELL